MSDTEEPHEVESAETFTGNPSTENIENHKESTTTRIEPHNELVKPSKEELEETATTETPLPASTITSNTSATSMKIRKRPLDSTEKSSTKPKPLPAFSRRAERSATPTRASAEPVPYSHNRAGSESPRRQLSYDDEPRQKLKRPSRRPPLNDQMRDAQLQREKEEYLQKRIEDEIAIKAQNLDSVVRQHYNQRTEQSRRERRNMSPIIKLRNFNNVIKHILINNFAHPGDRVIDLGCGKGGDLRKWETAQISEYLGIDISNASIVEAYKRYNRNRAPFAVSFFTGDAFGTPLPQVVDAHVRFPFDVVSMQFCLHYAFESEAKARMCIENVANSLRPGGYFIGTIPNSDYIGSRIRHLPPGENSFGNNLYSVTFPERPPKTGIFPESYGNVYNYYLKDAIDNVPEYVVPFDTLRSLAGDYGLRLQYKKTFGEFFAEQMPKWGARLGPRVLEGIRRTDPKKFGVEGDEAEAVTNFYIAFAFVKAGPAV